MTRNQEKFLTLMDNYATAMDYAQVAANSAGTAIDKYENSYLQSVEAAQERFTASFEKLSTTIWNSDFIRGAYDAGSGLLGFFTKLTETVGALPASMGALSIATSLFMNKGWLERTSDNRTYALLQSDGNIERTKLNCFGKRLYGNTLKWPILKGTGCTDDNVHGDIPLIA